MENRRYTFEEISNLTEKYGTAFYVLNSDKFKENYRRMLAAFRKQYINTYIAYSYKTNYTPKLCKIINDEGGYAEVVSGMEVWLAKKIGVNSKNIYFNGPYKESNALDAALLAGIRVNVDSNAEAEHIIALASDNLDKQFEVGVRCALDIGQNDPTRFGFDYGSDELISVINRLNACQNIMVCGLHCHLPFRDLDSFKKRMKSLESVLMKIKCDNFHYISMGGGYKGEISPELVEAFSGDAPSYSDYAQIVAGEFNRLMGRMKIKPKLIIEPGSAIVADCMDYITKVVSIKKSRDKWYATLNGSSYNMNPSVKRINRPIQVVVKDGSTESKYNHLDMVGYTCIEGDRLYQDYAGEMAEGDFVVFHNIGSYSIDMKPPFIMEDIPIIDIAGNKIELVRCAQTAEQVFENFKFNSECQE